MNKEEILTSFWRIYEYRGMFDAMEYLTSVQYNNYITNGKNDINDIKDINDINNLIYKMTL